MHTGKVGAVPLAVVLDFAGDETAGVILIFINSRRGVLFSGVYPHTAFQNIY